MKFWRADHLPETADDWVTAADEFMGSWREHWTEWLKARSGELVDAKQDVGSVEHPPLDVAPGRYVFEK
ncbi:MAG: polyhydroxyalkanoate synthase [Candidatus Azotimanducaceae bacterium]|jgi:polyhydroxyalkanoate synthase